MARKITKEPIMTPEAERFMIFEGLVQWTEAVITQAKRISEVIAQSTSHSLTAAEPSTVIARAATLRQIIHATHRECHFFTVAAYKLIEHRKRVRELGLCQTVDFPRSTASASMISRTCATCAPPR